MQQVLEHDALAAGALVRAQLLGDFVGRADETPAGSSRRASRRSSPRVGRARRVGVRGRGRRRASRRSGSRSSSSSEACGRRVRRPLRRSCGCSRTRPARRTACCTRPRSALRARRCRAFRCRRRGGADAASAPASAAPARPRACSGYRGSRRALPSRGGGRSRAARRTSRRGSQRSGKGKPYARCSRSIQPAPIPSSTRPPEMWSTVATAFASSPGQAEGGGGDERPEPERRRPRGEPRQRRPGVVRDIAVLVRLRDVVVGAEERLDAVLLARIRERAPLLPGDALLALDHQRDAHRAILSGRARHVQVPATVTEAARLRDRSAQTRAKRRPKRLTKAAHGRDGAWPRLWKDRAREPPVRSTRGRDDARDVPRRPQSGAAGGGPDDRRAGARDRRRRLGQDACAHASHRAPARRRRREAARDPRDHVHEQGRRRDARAGRSTSSARPRAPPG